MEIALEIPPRKIFTKGVPGLIVVDAQPDFLTLEALKTPAGQKLVRNIRRLISETPKVYIVEMAGGSKTHDCLFPRGWRRTEPISKHFLSAFKLTGLKEILENDGVGPLVVCGLESDKCVPGTAFDGIYYSHPVFVPSDAHGIKAPGGRCVMMPSLPEILGIFPRYKNNCLFRALSTTDVLKLMRSARVGDLDYRSEQRLVKERLSSMREISA
jgi:hypothetical protein